MMYLTTSSLLTCVFIMAVNGENGETLKSLEDRQVTKRSGCLVINFQDLLVREKTERKKLKKENQEIKAMLYKMKREADAIKKMVAKNKQTSARRLMNIQTAINAIKKKPGSKNTVGFTANVQMKTYKAGETLLFNSVKSNYGNDYNKATGQFVCSKPGMYLFHLTLLTTTSTAFASIQLNGVTKIYAYPSGNTAGTWESGSASLVVKLKVGDKVWVRCHRNGHFDPVTHFSGMLVAE